MAPLISKYVSVSPFRDANRQFAQLHALGGHPKPANEGHLKTGQRKTQDIDSDGGPIPSVNVSNVLSEEKKQQVIALGQLGWPLRRIEKATGVRRETAAAYLKAAGIAVRPPGGWGRRAPAKPANEVTTDPADSKPANEVTTDFSRQFHLQLPTRMGHQ